MKYHFLMSVLFFFFSPILLSTDTSGKMGHWNESTPLYQVLNELGDPMPAHYLPQRDKQAVNRGKEIVKYGVTQRPDGTQSKVQSRYFACTHCHNLRREDPDLRVSDPDTRLEYVIRNRLRFLPGTTLYGIVNRTTWFNGDYLNKYGDLTAIANKDLVKAIQLCATKCSMGRKLDDWELQSVLAYFWSIELKLGDLNLSESDWKKLKLANRRPDNNQGLISWLKGFYLNASPATFSKPRTPITSADEYTADFENGKAIYVLSCLSCHKSSGVTSFTLANSAVTYRLLNDHTDFGANLSVYNAIRNGIKASPGKGYMPNFPLQRISDNQIEDLRAFIKYQATHDSLTLESLTD